MGSDDDLAEQTRGVPGRTTRATGGVERAHAHAHTVDRRPDTHPVVRGLGDLSDAGQRDVGDQQALGHAVRRVRLRVRVRSRQGEWQGDEQEVSDEEGGGEGEGEGA